MFTFCAYDFKSSSAQTHFIQALNRIVLLCPIQFNSILHQLDGLLWPVDVYGSIHSAIATLCSFDCFRFQLRAYAYSTRSVTVFIMGSYTLIPLLLKMLISFIRCKWLKQIFKWDETWRLCKIWATATITAAVAAAATRLKRADSKEKKRRGKQNQPSTVLSDCCEKT